MVGRKNKYEYWLKDEGKTLLIGWLKRGLTDKQIIEKMGIATSTFYQWKIDVPEFLELFKYKKELALIGTEEALRKATTGYFVEEVKIITDGDKKPVRIEKTRKYIKPEVTAIMYYLQNVAPDVWKNVQKVEYTGKNGDAIKIEQKNNIDFSKMSKDDIMELVRECYKNEKS